MAKKTTKKRRPQTVEKRQLELSPGVKLRRTLESHQGPIYKLAFEPTGETLASGSEDTTVKLWNTRNGKLLHTLDGHSLGVCSLAFNPQGDTLASGGYDNTVILPPVSGAQCLFPRNRSTADGAVPRLPRANKFKETCGEGCSDRR
jgi:WD40 repeat protein